MLFGQQRYGRPSRFLLQLPLNDIEAIQGRAFSPPSRFIDRPSPSRYESPTPWRHPMAPRPHEASAFAGRYVDREVFDDLEGSHGAADSSTSALRRGSRVRHARFGEGEVRRIEHSAELIVVAFFPGWGEKKILARFLQQD
jgi:DNA helicase-2/ATP-dependent DNA helicase PcrA